MNNVFDVIVLGTGLSESITAAALARAGLKVAHIDPNPYYGADEATLNLDELVQWAETHSTTPAREPVRYRVDYLSLDRPPHPKQYSISLSPSVIPSVGPFISSIVSSGVVRYGSYKLLGPIGIYQNGKFQSVPQNKESIFQDQSLSLIVKRRLMRFLSFAAGDFENSLEFQGKEDTAFDHFLSESFGLDKEISQIITFSLASCHFYGESTLVAMQRVRSCLKSAGRYGSSPFLVGYYGGSGEIAQGFCRTAAVNGGVYILGRKILNLVVNEVQGSERFSIELEDIPDILRSSCILSSMACVPRYLQPRVNVLTSDSNVRDTTQSQVHAVARCIAIVHGTISPPRPHGTDDTPPVEGQSDSSLVIFPPGSLHNGSLTSSVTLLTAGPGTMSAPAHTNVIYLSMPLQESKNSSKELLYPYLTKILDSNPACQSIFQLFYMQHFAHDQPLENSLSNLFVLSSSLPDTFQAADQATKDAEKAYQSITQVVGLEVTCNKDKGLWKECFVDGDYD